MYASALTVAVVLQTHLVTQLGDVAAGVLIARQAGARITDYAGGDDYLFGRQIIACTPNIYEDFKQKVR